MIFVRTIAIICLLALLATAFYLPAVTTPRETLEIVHAEHRQQVLMLGGERAAVILSRAMDYQGRATTFGAAAARPSTGASAAPVDAAVAAQLAQMNARMFQHPYFRSLDSLYALACFRVATLRELLPLALLLALAAAVDGWVVRAVRSKEFAQHSPEAFTLSLCTAVAVCGALAMAALLPRVISPMVFVVAILATALALGRAIANYHRRG